LVLRKINNRVYFSYFKVFYISYKFLVYYFKGFSRIEKNMVVKYFVKNSFLKKFILNSFFGYNFYFFNCGFSLFLGFFNSYSFERWFQVKSVVKSFFIFCYPFFYWLSNFSYVNIIGGFFFSFFLGFLLIFISLYFPTEIFNLNDFYFEKLSAYECGFNPFNDFSRREFDVRFYLVGLLFLIFDLEIVFLFP
jgi:hypothetical protein